MPGKFIAALMVVGALLAPSYAKEKECVTAAQVMEEVGSMPHPIVPIENNGWLAFWDVPNGKVAMVFDKMECWTGEFDFLTYEEFVLLGPLNGERFV